MNFRLEMLRTAQVETRPWSELLVNAGLGLAGEAGEVCDLIKKHLIQGHPLNKEKLIEELGDVRWYLELAAHLLDVSMTDVESVNISKLRKRYPTGFSAEQSLKREGTNG